MIYAPIIANTDTFVYYLSMAKTKAIGFGDLLIVQGGRTAPKMFGGFFASTLSLSAPLWAGFGGSAYGHAGFLERQFRQAHQYSPPTPFGDGERVNQLVQGGHKMAQTSAPVRSEQTHSPTTFHLAARAARRAARLWFHGIPMQTITVWRDTCRAEHCEGLPHPKERGLAFNNAFAKEVGNLIIGGGGGHE